MSILTNKDNIYYTDNNAILLLGDSMELLKQIKPKSIDMIFADPPYFLSGDGITCSGGKVAKVKKADWDIPLPIEDKHTFNREWIKLCKEALKDDGTMWISGTMHNIYSVGMALEQEGFKIINNITWQKTNPPPNMSCRTFTHSTETILWAKKDIKNIKYTYNYEVMKSLNNDKQMKDVWDLSFASKSEKTYGKHPTQKPIKLLERIIQASTNENDIVLDPFNGSGTTGVACKNFNRRYIGIDLSEEYLNISVSRFSGLK